MSKRRSVLLWLTVGSAAFFLATSGGRLYVTDTRVKLETARALVELGSLKISDHGLLTVRSADGFHYSKFGFLHSLLFVPAVVTAKGMVAIGAVPPRQRDLVEGALASLLSPLLSALAVAGFFLLAREVSGSERRALVIAVLLGSTTMVWPYAKRGWSEVPQLSALVSAAWLLVSARRDESATKLLFGGGLVGCAVALRVTGLVYAPWFFLFLLLPGWSERNPWRRVALVGLGAAVVVLPLVLGVNWVRFGSILHIYSGRTDDFTTPFFKGLWGLLFSPGESVFVYSPILVLAPFLARRIWRADRSLAILVFGIPASALLLYSPWFYHAYTWGPRFLLPVIPFALLLLVFLEVPLRTGRRALLGGLVVLSLAVQVVGIGIYVGPYAEMARPLARAGWLPPSQELTREDTWVDPLRTRFAMHTVVAGELLGRFVGGMIPARYDLWPHALCNQVDWWPLTLRRTLGVPFAASIPIEAALLALLAWSAARLVATQRYRAAPTK